MRCADFRESQYSELNQATCMKELLEEAPALQVSWVGWGLRDHQDGVNGVSQVNGVHIFGPTCAGQARW